MSTRDLVVFAEDWASHPSSTQHLIKRLSEQYRVLWVNSIGLRRPRFSVTDMRRVYRKLHSMLAGQVSAESASTHAGSIHVLKPRVISWPGSRVAAALNRRLLGRQLRHAMASLGMSRPLVWTSLPSAIEVLDELDPSAVIYYCGDDFSALAGVDHAPVARQEARLLERADLILAASETLAERFPVAKTHCLPHGVDTQHFAFKQWSRPVDLPAGKPIAGFYGSLSNWLDQAMLKQVAQALPDWNIVLIGPRHCNIDTLLREPNITWLGPKAHQALPAYVQHWQVSLLPFVDNAQIRACNPLKLLEYLASGKPVVSTAFPAVMEYRDSLHLADTAEHFARAIVTAAVDAPALGEQWLERLNDWQSVRRLAQAAERRQACVHSDSWEQRAGVLAGLLRAL